MSFKYKVFINTFWSIGGQFSISLIQLTANIIFARFLSPNEFGQLGIVMFFVLLSNVLIEGGLGGALVRKTDATEKDFSTVFIFNLLVSLGLYFLILFLAGNIAAYYNDQQLRNLLIVSCSVLVLNSLNFVQNTRLVKRLQFKKLMIYRLISIILANSTGIILVILGFGVWSLIFNVILNPLFLSILLWSREGFFGKMTFSKASFRSMFSFGINTSLATIIDTVFNNIYQLIFAKYFSISETGLFFQAKKLQDVPNYIFFGTTNSVIFSSLAKLQNDVNKFYTVYTKIILYFSISMGLITLTTITYSREIVELLFGEKWIASGYYLSILSIASFFYVHEMFNRVIFKTFDNTKKILQLELLKKSLLTISIIIGVVGLDIKLLLFGYIIVSGISYLINYFYSLKTMGLNSWKELISVCKIIFSVAVSYSAIYVLKMFTHLGNYIILLFPVIIVVYFTLNYFQGIRIDIKYLIVILRSNKDQQDNQEILKN